MPNLLFWIFVVCLIIALFVITDIGYTNIVSYIKHTLKLNKTYTMYGYQYLRGSRSQGTVLATYTNTAYGLQCSNLAAVDPTCVGANWFPATQTCELLSSLLPLIDDTTCTLLIPGANSKPNNVSQWTASAVGTGSDGIIYCSEILGDINYAQSLCAAIPDCGAYTQEFAANTFLPMGCLKFPPGSTFSQDNTAMYTGTRTDGTVYNASKSPLFYRFGVTLNGTVLSSQPVQSPEMCAASTLKTAGCAGGSWSDTGICTLYSQVTNVLRNSTYTSFLPASFPNLLKYSNTYTTIANTSYSSTPNSYATPPTSLQSAMLNCANDLRCNAITYSTNTGQYNCYFDISQPVVDATSTAFVPPTVFI